MMPNPAARVDDNPSSPAASVCPAPPGTLDCPSAIFGATNPAVFSGGVRMIAQTRGAEAGPTARHLDHHPGNIRGQFPCAQS